MKACILHKKNQHWPKIRLNSFSECTRSTNTQRRQEKFGIVKFDIYIVPGGEQEQERQREREGMNAVLEKVACGW